MARVYRLDIPNALDNKVEQVPGQLFVEVTAKASEGEYAAACQAIGAGLFKKILVCCMVAEMHELLTRAMDVSDG